MERGTPNKKFEIEKKIYEEINDITQHVKMLFNKIGFL